MSKGSAVRVLGFAGSTRRDSFNRKLVIAALDACAGQGVETTFIDLKDYPLPIYDGDLEDSEGLPDNAARLKELLLSHDGLMISAPEYNGSIAPLLKNTLDWISRSPEATPDLAPYRGKIAAVMAASPGPLGGLRGLMVVRQVLTNVGVTVLANQVTLRGAHAEFADDGSLNSEGDQRRVAALSTEFAQLLRARAAMR